MKLHFLITFPFILFFAACNPPYQSLPPIDITAAKLVADYNENPIAADVKYKERALNISGEIANMSQVRGNVGVFLEDYNDSSTLRVVCIFDSSQKDAVWKLKIGQSVTFSG